MAVLILRDARTLVPILRDLFRARAPQDEDGRVRGSSPNRSRSFPSHDVKQPRSSRSRGACLRPGFAPLLHSPRIEGWAERRETFGCSGTRGAYHDAIRQAPSEALASHDAAIYGAK